MDWHGALAQLRQENLPGVLVTVVQVSGHAPRAAGAKMVVGSDHTWGTVGGGNLEEVAVVRARQLLAEGVREPEFQDSTLTDRVVGRHGMQCCGGTVRLLLEPFPARPVVAVFGLGHVGYELARILSRLELQLHLVDSRPEQLHDLRLAGITEGTADVVVHHAVLGEKVLELLPADATVYIMTHDHAEDFALCETALRSTGLEHIGLIGSRAKRARFRRKLAEFGHDEAALDRIDCPIGLPTIASKEPVAIAIGVAAALLQTLERRSGTSTRLSVDRTTATAGP